jgi:transposase
MRPRSNKPTNFAALFSQITRASRPFAKRQPIVCLAQVVAIRRRPWTSKNRGRYDRSRLRYPSDLTDDEWALVEPLIPLAKRGGNRRHVVVREVVNGLMYILSTGCQWRAIPKDLPPRSTLYDYFDLWSWDGTLDRIHDALYAQCRQAASREASPTAAIIDSQSVKSAEKGGLRLIRRATMPARRSKARSGTSSSIPRAC